MARLFVIPAREAQVAIILRRGPRPWYHTILWDTRRDAFMHGAWIKGRIYEEKCDLSPDGSLFIYNVRQSNRVRTSFTDVWTAISRPPWLRALVLWPHGTTYGGGGRFTGPRTLWGVSSEGTHPEFPFPAGRLHLADCPPAPLLGDQHVDGADWSGCDQKGRVIYTKGYVLFRRMKREDVLVADFTDLTPDPQPAPGWATRPV